MSGTTSKSTLRNISLIAVLAALAMGWSFYNGITTGNDFRQHFQFARSIHGAVISGDIYPGFASEPNEGLGDIGIRFYPPLGSYLLSAGCMITGDWYTGALGIFWLIFFVGGAGAYFFARESLPESTSLLAAALYIFAPYHLNEIYNNFLFAEFTATAVLPFCLLYIARICAGGNRQNAAGLAISYSLLVLGHLPLTMIGSLSFVIFAAFYFRRELFARTLALLSSGAVGGLLLSSFYWIRMVRELDLIKHSSPSYFAENFSYDRNFLFAPANWLNFNDDILNLWLADLMLLAALLVAIPSAIYLFKSWREPATYKKAAGAVLLIAVFMATPLSVPVWQYAPLLQKVQFPWRWMAIVSLFGAVFAASGISQAAEGMKRSKNILLPAGLGAVLIVFVFMAMFIVKQASYVSRDNFQKQVADIGRVRSYEGWWPIWATDRAFEQKEQVSVSGRTTEIASWNRLERRFNIDGGAAGTAVIRTFYYPEWKAELNEMPVPVSPGTTGLITIPVPAEPASVKLYFKEPALDRAAFYISVAAWVIIIAALLIGLFRSRRATPTLNHL